MRERRERGQDGGELELVAKPYLVRLGEPAVRPRFGRRPESRERFGADRRAAERADRLEDHATGRPCCPARAGSAPREPVPRSRAAPDAQLADELLDDFAGHLDREAALALRRRA